VQDRNASSAETRASDAERQLVVSADLHTPLSAAGRESQQVIQLVYNALFTIPGRLLMCWLHFFSLLPGRL
jgi:hypothetical protein